MTKRIDGSHPYLPAQHQTEPMSPEQLARCSFARTPQQRVESCNRKNVTENQLAEFLDTPVDTERSAVGRASAAVIEKFTENMQPGSKVELSAEARAGARWSAGAGASIEIARNGEAWELRETARAGIELGGHAGESELSAGLIGEVSNVYEYETLHGVRAGADIAIQKKVAMAADDLVDRSLAIREKQLDRHLVGQRMKLSAELLGKLGVAQSQLSAEAGAKLAKSSELAVNHRTGEITIETGIEVGARVAAGLHAGVRNVGAAAEGEYASISVTEKLVSTFKMTEAERERYAKRSDLSIIRDALYRGATSEKLVQHFDAAVDGEKVIADREIELNEKTPFFAAWRTDGVVLSWRSGARTDAFKESVDLGFLTARAEIKVQQPGAEIGKATLNDLIELLASRMTPDRELAAQRARANVGH